MAGSARSAEVVVIGAGPAGLAAAWRAARRGFSVRVLERAQHVGGMSSSFDIAGVRVDLGGHRLHPGTPPRVLQDLQRLLGDDLQTRVPNDRIRIADRWVPFPVRASELARRLPRGLSAGVARDAMIGPLRRARRDTYAERVRARFGGTVYNAVYGPYAEKLWGLPGSQISGEQARRLATVSSPARPDIQFHYPRRGFGQIVDRLAYAAAEAGAEIVLGAEVDGVAPTYDDVRVHTRDGVEVDAGIAFSTLSLPLLARITSPGPSLTAIEAASRLRFRAIVLVYVVHKGGRWTPYEAHYVPAPDTPVSRLSEPANYRDSADDPADRSVVCAEIPCAIGDTTWTGDDDSLAALVEQMVERAGLPPMRSAETVVRRVPAVYPVYELGYERRLAGIEAWISGVPQIVSLGRLGLYAHDHTHHAMLEAYEAVDSLRLDGTFDQLQWREVLG